MDYFRAVQVPGAKVIEAYCKLVDEENDAQPHSLLAQLAEAKQEGFRLAVDIYCPRVPGYFSAPGYLIMAGDRHLEEKEIENE